MAIMWIGSTSLIGETHPKKPWFTYFFSTCSWMGYPLLSSHHYGKSPYIMSFPPWKWWFSSSLCHKFPEGKSHQLPLNHHFPMVVLCFSYGLPEDISHFQCEIPTGPGLDYLAKPRAPRAPGPTMAVKETAPITAGAGWSRPMACAWNGGEKKHGCLAIKAG